MAADRIDRPAAGTGQTDPAIEVRRSPRRRRTVSAYREGDRTVVLIPAQMSAKEEERWVRAMVERLERRERRSALEEPELSRRAMALSAQYLGGKAHPVSVRWVSNQAARWGSCTPVDGTIRISDRVRSLPDYVVDYVLLHELAHLLVPNHGPAFWNLLAAYPRTERARGFLEGYARSPGGVDGAGGQDHADGEDEDVDEAVDGEESAAM